MSIFHIIFTERIKVHLKFKGQKNSILWNFRRVNSSGWKMGFSMSPPPKFLLQYIFVKTNQILSLYMHKNIVFTPSLCRRKNLINGIPHFHFSLNYFSWKILDVTDLLCLWIIGRKLTHCPLSRKILKHW